MDTNTSPIVPVARNSIIIDGNNMILFCGKTIYRDLVHSQCEGMAKSVFDLFPDQDAETLLEKMLEARSKKKTVLFHHVRSSKKIFIIPDPDIDDNSLTLSTDESLLSIHTMEHALRERIKELECIYNINNTIDNATTLEEAFTHAVPHMVQAFQFQEITQAYFLFDGKKYGYSGSIDTARHLVLREPITVFEAFRGEVVVIYTKKIPFLKEEEKLIKEIAYIFSKTIERIESAVALRKQQDVLRQKNEKLLELSEQCSRSSKKLEALFNALTDCIIVVDRNYSITMSNKRIIDIKGKCYRAIFNREHICEECPVQMTFQQGIPYTMERKDNNNWYLLNTYPILSEDGTVDRVISIYRTITKQKHIEHQLFQSYKLASMGKLISGIAHEINNPNTFIRGNIKIIQEMVHDILPLLDTMAKGNEHFKIARLPYPLFRENIPVLIDDMAHGANRIKKIVDGLLSYVKKDDGLLIDDVRIVDVIEHSVRLVDSQIKRNAKVVVECDSGMPVFKGNAQKLEQVMINLLVNASQAIIGNGGIITVRTKYDPALQECIVEVHDNGKGMDEKDLRCIFDPFFTTKRTTGGTGLGLSISYGIIKEHHGRIEVESEPGKGTSFILYFPLTKKEYNTTAQPAIEER